MQQLRALMPYSNKMKPVALPPDPATYKGRDLPGAPGVATPAIPQGYRHHQETAFQFPCSVELHSARYPGPLSN